MATLPPARLPDADRGTPPPSLDLEAFPEGSFDRVYHEHAALLRHIAVHDCDVPIEDAKGLVHDVFATYLTTTNEVRNIRRYLVAAIHYASNQYWRRRRGERAVPAEAAESVAADDGRLVGLTLHLTMAVVLSRIGRRCREVIRRSYYRDEPVKVIAAAIETSPGNVKWLLHACRKRVQRIYEEIARRPA